MNWSDFLNADSDAIVFVRMISYFLNFKCRGSITVVLLVQMGFSLSAFLWLQNLLILLSDEVEINPGLTSTSKASLSICHWNLNSVFAHNYVKLSLLTAYLVFHKSDIICPSETYPNSSNSPDDDTLDISENSLVRSDHPFNSRREGVCIYCKNYLPLRILASIIYQNV